MKTRKRRIKLRRATRPKRGRKTKEKVQRGRTQKTRVQRKRRPKSPKFKKTKTHHPEVGKPKSRIRRRSQKEIRETKSNGN